MRKVLIIIIIFVFFLTGCEKETYLDDPLPNPKTDTRELTFGMSTFGFDFYKILLSEFEDEENMVFSPYSISSCLGMVYAGARGNTAEQIAEVFNYTLAEDGLHQTFGRLSTDLIANNNIETTELQPWEEIELTLKTNNGGWLQQDYGILDSYTTILEDNYVAMIEFVDFSNDSEQIVDAINQWTDNNTAGKIPKIVSRQMVKPSTRLVLVNTIYLKGSWQYPFDEALTVDRPFYTLGGTTIDVPMMSARGAYRYAEDARLQAVSLPLVQSSLGLVILLPQKGAFNEVEQSISAGGLYSVVEAMEYSEVSGRIPRFKVRTKRLLNDDLKKLGMTDAFSEEADFSGMDGGIHPLYLSFVVHEAVIEVNEQGLEAAAVTAAVISEATATGEIEKPKEFIADRPFLYAVYDFQSDAVLFLGRVREP